MASRSAHHVGALKVHFGAIYGARCLETESHRSCDLSQGRVVINRSKFLRFRSMKRFSSLSVPLMLVVASVEASAAADSSGSITTTDCSVIVSQTVSEMRIGAKAWWSDDVEKMAGMAAMSACFKVVSAQSMSSAENKDEAGSGASSTLGATTQQSTSSGLSFRPLSGSASKKPYERARARKEPK